MSRFDAEGLQTLLVGLDGACLPVVEPMVADGRLPVLADLLERGASGPLESQIPPWTPSAWTSICTGVNPGKHGVFDFLTFDGYDWDVVNHTYVRERTIWELLSEHGVTSVVVNVPVTHPPRSFDGALIPGYTAPEDPQCHPDGLLDDVREAIGEYTVSDPRSRGSPTRADRIEGYRELTRMRGEAFGYLVDRFDPDFGFVQFQQTDSVFHELPGDSEAVETVYETVDETVGDLLDSYRPNTVIVASDHGIGPYDGYEFRVNEFLERHGYVETTSEGEGMPSWTAAKRELSQKSRGVRALSRATEMAASVGVTSQRVGAVLDRLGLTDVVASHLPTDAIRAGTEQVDFASSTAYMRSRTEIGVRVNLRGREPGGTVSPDEYDGIREDLISLLADVRTPEGEPVFDDVLPREDVFSGPYVEKAPDVVTVPADYEHLLSASLRGDEFGQPSEPYEHKPVGLLAAVGEAIDAGAAVESAHLFDVAPTVLSSLGFPASDRMDGRALPFVESAGIRPYPTFDAVETTETDDPDVERRLADLGYLE